MFTIDAHLDLAMNAMEWNRDLRKPIPEIREREKNMKDKPDRGNGVVSFDEMRKANVGLVVATQIARYVSPENSLSGWHSPEQAWAHTQGQLAWYKTMEEAGELVQIKNRAQLQAHIDLWQNNLRNENKPIGYILSLEGADSMITVNHLQRAYEYGLRAVGPGHYGPGRYAQGTNATGGIGAAGKALLREMERLNMILDATHLSDESFREALDHFRGPVWASHNNCRALVDSTRQFTDDQIKELIQRGAVIGAVMHAGMMVTGWQKGVSNARALNCKLATLIDHMDHICQIAGNANHIGIGSDLDGGFGKEESPYDLETIADLQKIPDLLRQRGYSETDLAKVMHGNFLHFLLKVWE